MVKLKAAHGDLTLTPACNVKANAREICVEQLLACPVTSRPLCTTPVYRPKLSVYQVLQLLRNTMGASITLYLNPPRDLTDLPLKAFYRFALPDVTPGVGQVWGRCHVAPRAGQVWEKCEAQGAVVASVHMHMAAP